MFKFNEESLEKEEKRRVTEICREIIEIELKDLEEERRIIKEELKGLREKIEVYEKRMSRIEIRLEEIVEWTKKKEEEEQVEERDRGEDTRSVSSVGSVRENSSIRSEGGESVGNSLSAREVEKIRRWVIDKDREDRKRNNRPVLFRCTAALVQ